MTTALSTAIEAWDKRWATAKGRADWLHPDPDVMALLPDLKARGAHAVLDLGCGVGRHALFQLSTGWQSKRSTAAPPVWRSCARRLKPAAYRWVCD